MTVHELKILPEHFSAVLKGDKTFELRKNDRNFAVGDLLRLREHQPRPDLPFTGRQLLVRVTYVSILTPPPYSTAPNYAIMSFKIITFFDLKPSTR